MDSFIKAFKKLQSIITVIIGITLILMMFVILAQTFTRYVIFYSLPWSEELSRYLFVLMILLGINVGISQNLMVRIDLIDGFLKGKAKRVLETVRDVICLVVTCIFTYSSIGMIAIGRFQKSPAMQIPMHLMYILLFIGFLFAVLSILVGMYERHGKSAEEGLDK